MLLYIGEQEKGREERENKEKGKDPPFFSSTFN